MTAYEHDPSAAAIAGPDGGGCPTSLRGANPNVVEIRHRGRLASFLSMMSCCSRSGMSESVHFHANRVEDSVHVMIKHDKDACKRRGQPEKAYTPRQPLSERLDAARKMQAARIEAKEDDESDMDKDILAAVSRADCGSGGVTQ